MTILERIKQASALFAKYGALAAGAVAQVQSEIGPSNGDITLQQSKKQLAVLYVIAAAHAGETVPVGSVQAVSTVVDLLASSAKMLGLFGKTATAAGSISIPAAAPVAVLPVAPLAVGKSA